MCPSPDEAARVYRQCVAVPTPIKAGLRQTKEGVFSVLTNWTQPDLERSEKVTFQSVHVILPDGENKFGKVVDAGRTAEVKPE